MSEYRVRFVSPQNQQSWAGRWQPGSVDDWRMPDKGEPLILHTEIGNWVVILPGAWQSGTIVLQNRAVRQRLPAKAGSLSPALPHRPSHATA